MNFLLVGHTHEDVDALFGRWSHKLKSSGYPTLPLLMNLFMDVETKSVIPHVIEKVPNFNAFLEGYISDEGEALEGNL